MIINTNKFSILPRTNKSLAPCKSLSKFLAVNSMYAPVEGNNSIHHSQKKLEVITQSNFVITKTKPVANPWNECFSSFHKKTNKLLRCRARLEAIVNHRPLERAKIPSDNSTFNKSLNPCFQSPIKKRNSSLSGWT